MTVRPPARWRRIIALGLAVTLVAGGCTDDGTDAATATSTTIPRPNTVMRLGVEDWPTCVNPLTCADDALHDLVLQHVLPVAFELDSSDDYQPSAMLAATPTVVDIEGGVEIRYEIAPEARWADGRPITSSDFLGTWQAIMATPDADRLRYDHVVAVDDRDPSVAVVTLDAPLVDWQELFGGSSGYVLQADAFGASADLTGQFLDELPFAAGPYLLSSWSEAGAVLSATAPWEGRDEARIDQVRIDRVEIASLDDAMTFDMLIPSADSDAEAPEGFDVRTTASTTVLGVWFDQREPALQPVEHRRAIELLLDRAALTEAAGLGEVVSCAGWVPEVGPWCDAASIEPAAVDAAAASAQLAAQGWVKGGYGLLFRDDVLLSVPVTTDVSVPGSSVVAELIREALLAGGIEATVSDVRTSEWRGSRSSGASTGLGVYALDLGVSPRVDDLYGCPDGVDSSVLGSCPSEITGPARDLATMGIDDALAAVDFLGAAADLVVSWLPLGVVPERSFVRQGRVAVADASNAAGGPLAGLDRFEADA
ncbi:ABC transporter substrate-binding protein [Actinospongicola halichondriae]|uniref:ABC transporter substrate-binding protein n=1 Tax=Actinospongicola halichondriae TaxID=3236844 RepID=UPI003D56099A